MREAILKVLGCAVLDLAAEQPENVEQLVEIASVFKAILKSEENDIKRARLKLAEEYFDYEKQAAFQEELPHVRAQMMAISRDASLSDEEKTKRLHELLFGRDQSKPDENKPDKSDNGK